MKFLAQHIMDAEEKRQAEEKKIAERADQLFNAYQKESTQTLVENIANLIVPALQKRHIHRRQFEKRTLVVRLDKYQYKLYYEEFTKPVKVEREEIELEQTREVM